MLYQWVGATNFDQNTCQFPLNSSIRSTSAAHDAFYAELAARLPAGIAPAHDGLVIDLAAV